MNVNEFLEKSAYGWKAAGKLPELKEAYADADTMDAYEWVSKWGPVITDTPELTADFYESKLLSAKPLAQRMVQSFGTSDRDNPFNKSDKWINQLYHSEFSDVPREKFDRMLGNMSAYWEDEKKARTYEAGKKRREKETKDWGWRNFLASDYAKERYINEPETAIFGKEAPGFLGSSAGAKADLAAGATAALLDVVPTPIGSEIWAGPLVRSGRDVAYSGTEYGKSGGELGSSLVSDLGLNAGVAFLPNFRTYLRGVKGAEKSMAPSIMMEDYVTTAKKSLDSFPTKTELSQLSDVELWKRIDMLPESPIKQDLKKYAPNVMSVDRAGIADEIDRAGKVIDLYENPTLRQEYLRDISEGKEMYPKIGERQIESQILTEPVPTKTQELTRKLLGGTKKVLQSEPAAGALKTSKTMLGLRDGDIKTDPQSTIDWYKANYSRDFEMGFKPSMREGDPKWEAYSQWYFEKYGKMPEGTEGGNTWINVEDVEVK